MDPSSEIDYDARLAALAAAFAQGLADKHAAIARCWRAWQAGDASARDELRALAHRLGGAADNYGYVALGEAARAGCAADPASGDARRRRRRGRRCTARRVRVAARGDLISARRPRASRARLEEPT